MLGLLIILKQFSLHFSPFYIKKNDKFFEMLLEYFIILLN